MNVMKHFVLIPTVTMALTLATTGVLSQDGKASQGAAEPDAQIVVNGKVLGQEELDLLEQLGRQYGAHAVPGRYWYDRLTGLYGLEGGPTVGQVSTGSADRWPAARGRLGRNQQRLGQRPTPDDVGGRLRRQVHDADSRPLLDGRAGELRSRGRTDDVQPGGAVRAVRRRLLPRQVRLGAERRHDEWRDVPQLERFDHERDLRAGRRLHLLVSSSKNGVDTGGRSKGLPLHAQPPERFDV